MISLRRDVAEQFETAWLRWMQQSPHSFWVAFVLCFKAQIPYAVVTFRAFHEGEETITMPPRWAHVLAVQLVCRRWRSALRTVKVEILKIHNALGVQAFWQPPDLERPSTNEITWRMWIAGNAHPYEFQEKLRRLLQSRNRSYYHHHLLIHRNMVMHSGIFDTCDPLWARNVAAASDHSSSDNDSLEVHNSEGSY